MPSLTEIINDINKIDLSGRSGIDVNWPYVVRALQGLLAVYQGMDRSGTIPSDHLTSFIFGDGTTRKLRRIVYVQATQTVKIQKNTGSDVTPNWVDILSIDTSGNLTISGSLTGTLPSHISTHLPGASDPIPTGTPVDIGAANAAGSGTALALANHVHEGVHGIDKDGSGTPFVGDINFISSARIPLSAGANSITVGFTSPNRVYASSKSLGDQSIISSTAALAISGLGNLTITGANGSKKYKVWASANVSTTNTALNLVTLNIHLGTAGTTADTVFWSTSGTYDISAGTKGVNLACSGLEIIPTSSQKLTVSIQLGTSVATAHTIQNSDPKYCFILIEEEL